MTTTCTKCGVQLIETEDKYSTCPKCHKFIPKGNSTGQEDIINNKMKGGKTEMKPEIETRVNNAKEVIALLKGKNLSEDDMFKTLSRASRLLKQESK